MKATSLISRIGQILYKGKSQYKEECKRKVELAERESETLYQTIIENSLDGVVLMQGFKVLYFNRIFAELLGYTQEELYQVDPMEVIAYKDREKVFNYYERQLNGELKNYNFIIEMLRKDGSHFTAELNVGAIQFKGNLTSIIAIRDITQKEKLAQALRESEQNYKTLVENSQDGFAIVRANKVLFANPAYCRMLGYTPEQLYKMNALDVLHPDDVAKLLKMGERSRTMYTGTINMSYRMVTISGDVRECESSSTMIKYGGEWANFFTVHDVTESNRMQKALSESERKFRELTEMLPQAVYELDENNKPTFMNKTGRDMFLLGDADFIGDKAYDFFIPEDAERMNEDLNGAARRANPVNPNLELASPRAKGYTAKRADGTTFPVLIYGTPIFEDGVFRGSRGIIIDITERVRMENELRLSEERFRELADFLPQTIYEIDLKGNLLYVNKTGMEIFGLSEADYGKPRHESFVPEDRDRNFNNLMLTMKGERKGTVADYMAIGKNGRKFPVLIYGIPLVKDGEIKGARGMIVDISERKETEQALKESEEKYRMLVDDANDGIVLTQEGKLKLVNKAMCKILQYDFAEFKDKPFYDFIFPDDRAQMLGYHQRRMSGEEFTILYRARLIRRDGEIITVELNARTLYFNNQPAAFIIIRDISERIAIENELKAAKEQLEKLNKNLENMVAESSEKLAETHMQLVNLQKENLQSQFDVLRQQVNPHFLFNSLNVLTSLIKIEPDLAEQFSEHLSKVYRYVLENKDNELVSLSTELKFLDAYIFLLNIRFVDKIKVNISIPDNKLNNKLIPLAMQLLIENAIKHNIMSKSAPLVIDIFIDKNNFLNIINNLQERPTHIVSTGVGLKNIENRYLLLNNTKPVFEKTETQFVAKVPLVEK